MGINRFAIPTKRFDMLQTVKIVKGYVKELSLEISQISGQELTTTKDLRKLIAQYKNTGDERNLRKCIQLRSLKYYIQDIQLTLKVRKKHFNRLAGYVDNGRN